MFYYEELAIPGQTATGKESSNPFMAGSLPKTIHFCDSLQSDEDSFELIELMILCTNFLTMVRDLENLKTTYLIMKKVWVRMHPNRGGLMMQMQRLPSLMRLQMMLETRTTRFQTAIRSEEVFGYILLEEEIGLQTQVTSNDKFKVEAQLVTHQKNQLWYEEKIRFIKIDLDDKTDVLTYHKKLLAEAVKEKEELKTKLENFQSSFKGLSKVLNSQMSTRDKSRLGYGDQVHNGVLNYENEVLQSVFDSRSSDVEDSPMHDRFATVKGLTCSSPSVDRKLHAFRTLIKNAEKTLESMSEPSCRYDPKVVQANLYVWYDAPFIDLRSMIFYWTCDLHEKMTKQVELNKKKGKGTGQGENRPVWNNVQRLNYQNKFVSKQRIIGNLDNPQKALKNKGIVDSGYSMYMTGNRAYLAEYQDYNGGLVAFGGSKGYITCKEDQVLFTDNGMFLCCLLTFKLPDENQALLRVPRQNNMYSFNLENIVPSGAVRSEIKLNKNCRSQKKLILCAVLRKEFAQSTEDLLLQAGAARSYQYQESLEDESWVDAMQEKLLKFKIQKIEAIRIFLAFASYMGFIVYQMDVKSAFLYGTIDEEVYVSQPLGFVDPKFPKKVYKVVKALYGLHQAPKACTPIETQKPLNKDEEAVDVDVSGGLISWQCKEAVKQSVVLSTYRGVYVAAANCYGQAVVVTEASIRSSLLLHDTDGTACLTNEAIFQNLALMGYEAPKGEGSEQPTEPQPTPSPTQPISGDQPPVTATSSSHDTTQYSRDSLEGTNRSEGDQRKLGRKESVSKQGRKNAKPRPTLDVFDDLDADLAHGIEYMDTEEAVNKKGGSTISTVRPERVSTAGVTINTADPKISVVEPRTLPTTTCIFDDEDVTMAQTLIKMKEEKAKEKGVAFKDVEDFSRPARSILTLKPLLIIDPKDKGKGVLQETEPAKKMAKSGFDAAQIARDVEIARQLEVDWQAEEERKRQREEEESKAAIAEMYDEVQAGIDAEHYFVSIGSAEEEKIVIEDGLRRNGEITSNKEKVLEELDSTKVKFKQEGNTESTRKKPGRRLKIKATKKSKSQKTDSDLEEKIIQNAFLMIV
ncbi:putative ribonuclease H-like domain-containing protein [Tanacetum coccineum]